MSEKSMIIIGAGLGGLSSGIYGQMSGYRTHIFEYHNMPGGVVTSWKRNGYTFDSGVSWLIDYKTNPIPRELGVGEDSGLYGELDQLVLMMDERTGQALNYTSDLDRLAQDMKAISPGDGPLIDEMIHDARKIEAAVTAMHQKGSRPLTDEDFKLLKKHMGTRVLEYVRRFKDPFLQWSLRSSVEPDYAVLILLLLLGSLESGNCGYLKTGAIQIAKQLAKRYEDLGGEITYKATVEKILVENDQAVGVRLADGTEHRADIVISACDGYSTIFKMLGGRYVSQRIQKIYNTHPMNFRLTWVSFGTAQTWPDQEKNMHVLTKRPISTAGHDFKGFYLKNRFADPAIADPGKSIIQVGVVDFIGTDFENWWNKMTPEEQRRYLETISNFWIEQQEKDRKRYDEEKERLAGVVLDRIEPYFPGIRSKIEVTDVSTPYTWLRYTLNHQGSCLAWLFSPELSHMNPLERTLPGLNNFYMTGQWVGDYGVLMAMEGARKTINTVCKKDGKELKCEPE